MLLYVPSCSLFNHAVGAALLRKSSSDYMSPLQPPFDTWIGASQLILTDNV